MCVVAGVPTFPLNMKFQRQQFGHGFSIFWRDPSVFEGKVAMLFLGIGPSRRKRFFQDAAEEERLAGIKRLNEGGKLGPRPQLQPWEGICKLLVG